MSSETQAAPREYGWHMPRGWWTRSFNYSKYMLREFTAVPMALWLLWFLVEVQRAQNGPSGYYPHMSMGFVVFSVICLAFALYHSITFLSLAGVIIHINVADRPVPPRLIVLTMFGAWAVATIVIGAVLIGFAR